jgi:sulfite exporter TauE/SafE
MLLAAFLSGAAVGLVVSPHCVGMCGPLSAFACHRKRRHAPLLYQAGRWLGYGALGAAAGSIGSGLVTALSASWAMATLSWLFAIALIYSAVQVWRPRKATAPLAIASKPPRRSLARRIFDRLPNHPLALGTMSALLPCAALLSAVVLAAATAHPMSGAATMVGFATTTGVAVIAAGYLASRLRSTRLRSRVLAAVLIAGAVVMVLRPLPSLLAEPGAEAAASCPLHAGAGQ